MRSRGALLACVIGFSIAVRPVRPAVPIRALAPPPGCNAGLAAGDTARFTGVMVPSGWAFASDPPQPPGTLKLWIDPDGRFHYVESWLINTITYVWDGDVGFGAAGLPRSFSARMARNGVVNGTELIEQSDDSVVVVRNGARTAERLGSDVVRLPAVRSAPLLALMVQCALSHDGAFQSKQFGAVRARKLATIAPRAGGLSQPAVLYQLTSDSVPQLAAAWLESGSRRLIAMRFAEGVMDLVSMGWEGSLDQLVEAEARAALPPNGPETCAGGGGVGSCAPAPALVDEACKHRVKSLTPRPGPFGGTVTFNDSGYSVSSDGLGPYVHGSSNVRVMCCGIGGFVRLTGTSRGSPRAFSLDLSHPLPGDIGVPLGTVKVDGAWPGTFTPAGASFSIEINFFHMNADSTEFTGDIPVGATVQGGVGIDFYLHGLHHLLAIDPAPGRGMEGPCSAEQSGPVDGRGTTAATISRPTATTWIIDLPPGSIGRLLDNHRGDRNAVNKGLYYVSLHFVIQQ